MKRLTLSACIAVLLASASTAAIAQTELSLWYHGAGNDAERSVLETIIDDFNASQSDWTVNLEQFPQLAYADAVTAAALSGDLPDIIDVDGPIMSNWAWAGYFAPLGIDEEKLADFLPSTIGRYNDEIYSVGLWDATTTIFARQSILEKYDIRIPTVSEPWTADEFESVLATFHDSDEFEYAIDMAMNNRSEWFSYGFNTFLISAGGDLIDRESYRTAEGALNGDAALAWGNWFQDLFEKGYLPGTDEDPALHKTGFDDGSFALDWYGNWRATQHVGTFGDDLIMLPPPDLGNGPKTGAGSWQFGISANSQHKDGARAFLEFAIQDKYIAAFSDTTGLIPATKAATALTKNYKPGGAYEMLYDYMQQLAVSRPATPAYATISQQFNKVVGDIADGADVQETLDAAVDVINADLKRNNYYGR